MTIRKRNSPSEGFFLLAFFILALYVLKGLLPLYRGEEEPADLEKVYIEIRGEVRSPGVYGCSGKPDPERLLAEAGAPVSRLDRSSFKDAILRSGATVVVTKQDREARISIDRMSAFYKATLGIPISVNRETAEGLTAIPGVGPKTALNIVQERERRGGFRRLEDLLSVSGIGPALFNRIRSYMTL